VAFDVGSDAEQRSHLVQKAATCNDLPDASGDFSNVARAESIGGTICRERHNLPAASAPGYHFRHL